SISPTNMSAPSPNSTSPIATSSRSRATGWNTASCRERACGRAATIGARWRCARRPRRPATPSSRTTRRPRSNGSSSGRLRITRPGCWRTHSRSPNRRASSRHRAAAAAAGAARMGPAILGTRMKTSVGIVLLVLCAAGAAEAKTAAPILAAVADTTRPKDDVASDANRQPIQTLAFSGVMPGMTVAELYPCGGYFSRMLSDVVGPRGKVIGLETTRWKACLPADQKMVAALPQKNMTVEGFAFGEFTLPEKVDLFWITQNYHDLHIKQYGDVDMAAFNKHVFDSLKPGGVYFILDHQANPGTGE